MKSTKDYRAIIASLVKIVVWWLQWSSKPSCLYSDSSLDMCFHHTGQKQKGYFLLLNLQQFAYVSISGVIRTCPTAAVEDLLHVTCRWRRKRWWMSWDWTTENQMDLLSFRSAIEASAMFNFEFKLVRKCLPTLKAMCQRNTATLIWASEY